MLGPAENHHAFHPLCGKLSRNLVGLRASGVWTDQYAMYRIIPGRSLGMSALVLATEFRDELAGLIRRAKSCHLKNVPRISGWFVG